ncbi:MAG: HAD family hydrolase [Herminiimonas sp.]|nr:HAD family hydrolase [Herminiimonas sp.]
MRKVRRTERSRVGAPTWFFDLDNTLHDASHQVFPAINANMNAYIAAVLGDSGMPADAAAVNAARIGYLRRYGATLLGMVHHHQVRPAHFLEEVHRFDDLAGMLRAEAGLGRHLARLPGAKILLTNAPRDYSTAVVRHFGLQHHFGHHIAIEAMQVHRQLRPKPSKGLLRKLLARHRTPAHRCILVEDTLANLKAAKALGMRTVWITGYLRSAPRSSAAPAAGNAGDVAKTRKRPAFVDVKVKSLKQLFDSLPGILRK